MIIKGLSDDANGLGPTCLVGKCGGDGSPRWCKMRWRRFPGDDRTLSWPLPVPCLSWIA
jgi:hypothetical protein